MCGPLDGVRVLDFSNTLAGPYCTMVLGDLGADVVKVEGPQGDISRGIGPARSSGMGAYFLNTNRNKRSLMLDLSRPRDRATVLELAQSFDVVVHSMRPKTLEKLGLTYEVFQDVNPKMVYCHIVGFSSKGPYYGKPAYDDLIQASSGMAWLQGRSRDGSPEYVASLVADKTTGLMAVTAITSALVHRGHTGEGQKVEVPMFEVMSSFALVEHLYGLTFDPPRGPGEYPRATSPGRRPYRTDTGYLAVMMYTDGQWAKFFDIIGEPNLMTDPRFKDIGSRTRHTDELYALVQSLMTSRTTTEWMDVLSKADIPCMPVNAPEDLLHDAQLQQGGFFVREQHSSEGPLVTIPTPITFSRTPLRPSRMAPRLGEHSATILAEMQQAGEYPH